MKKFLKKSVVLSILSITALSSVDNMLYGTPMEDRLEQLRNRRLAANIQAQRDADAIETKDSLSKRRDALDVTRNDAIDRAFAEIGRADDQIEQLFVFARQRDVELVNKTAAFQAATNAIAGLSANISRLRIQAAASAVYQRALVAAEEKLQHFEDVAKELGQTLSASVN